MQRFGGDCNRVIISLPKKNGGLLPRSLRRFHFRAHNPAKSSCYLISCRYDSVVASALMQ